jgi:N6-L-threonylcarbamoyladenine synthase
VTTPVRILALETSCDETAVAICEAPGRIVASRIASQALIHRAYGGVVPEVASRNHIIAVRPLIEEALAEAGLTLGQIDAFAATAGPGLASSLLVGNTVAKALALAHGRPFLAINHLEGHLLSPFIGTEAGVRPCVALIVSGGHTSLLRVRGFGEYTLLGKTRDDAAGEAFDKVAKMLGLPYPGGPEVDRHARNGEATRYRFPRSMLGSGDFAFSFSGLKTAVLYQLEKLDAPLEVCLDDLCASFQEAVVDILVGKTLRAARKCGQSLVTVSGGVSCNARLREAFTERCAKEGLELSIAPPDLSTDNAAMIAYVAFLRHAAGHADPLEIDVDPNLPVVVT